MLLDTANIEAFALGCAILSAGGGGDTAIGLVMARHAIAESGPVEIVDPDALDPETLIMPCGLIGSPTVAQERVWNGQEGAQLVRAVEGCTHSSVRAMMCYEIAGVNGLLPVMWASRLGKPLLDADGMGRAFPEMQQQAMHLAGIAASPVVLTDGRDNVIVVNAAGNLDAERIARSCTATFGGTCAGALYPMTARSAAAATIRGSVSRALRIGEMMRTRHGGWPAALADETAGRVLIEGRVTEIQRRTGAGFSHGHAVVDGAGASAGRRLRLELQNEVLVALEDGEVLVTVPDIIAVLTLAEGRPVGTERLHYGQRVGVVVIPGPGVWRTEEGLRVVGPRSFGYDVDYVRGATGDGN
ncbi:DUF917 domain-containing protein [Streptomyces sp. NPDC046197]|uniref:DUF917 domain-containing protein n=1 Tax=Streptomyces sp. NPDC046197 TaxID=3154337 RepID=UPI0033D6872F